MKRAGLSLRRHILFLLLPCLLLPAGCASVPHTGRQQLSLLPEDEVLKMSLQEYRKVIAEAELSDDEEDTDRLGEVGGRIAAAAEEFLKETGYEYRLENFDWEFALIEDDEEVNAWCMPGGKIAFYTGILPYTEDEGGIAVVMGHEVAHALANHGNERLSHLLLVELGAVALSEALDEESETTRDLWMIAYGLGSTVGVVLPYSRTQEYEADRIGLILTAKAGYDPREAVSFWTGIMEGDDDSSFEFLSTHPATENRIQAIRELVPEALSYYH